MRVASARYDVSGAIVAEIDGTTFMVPAQAGNRYRKAIAAWEAEGNRIAAFVPPQPTVEQVDAEKNRRLALGFTYDFGDARGVHHIGTTEKDMKGWDEVTKYANALRTAGDTTTTIAILTDTGPASITPDEWNRIMLAAAAYRQPIWQASFVLAAMDPVPADYADDSHWPS